MQRFTYWMPPNWKTPISCHRVEIVHGQQNLRDLSTAAILHILTIPVIHTAYTREEINKVFNDEVLSKYGGGRYFSKNNNPRETLDQPAYWSDLLNNTMSIVLGNISYLEGCEKAGVIPDDVIEDVLPDIQTGLKYCKIIEDWIHYNRDFMLKLYPR